MNRMTDIPLQTAIEIIKNEGKQSNEVVQKNFVWDQFVTHASSAILALTVLSVTVEFFRGGGGVACFHPSETASSSEKELTSSQATFINRYCSDSLPVTEYYPVYILAHGILLVLPHYVWSAIFKGHFDSFFSVATKIHCLRDSEIGEYSEESFSRVRKLEKKYGKRNWIFTFFVLKLLAQSTLSVSFLYISAVLFREFSFSFNCSLQLEEAGLIEKWLQNTTTFPCVYTSFRFLFVVWICDLVLTGLVALMSFYGLIWCFWKHGRQLGYYLVAEFAFQSLLEPNFFELPRFLLAKHSPSCCPPCCCCLMCDNPKKSIYPRIKSDLDFLSLILYRSDPFYGEAFRDILVSSLGVVANYIDE